MNISRISRCLIILFVSEFLCCCEKTELTDNLSSTENFIYYDTRFVFQQSYYYYVTTPNCYLSIYTDVTVPDYVIIKDYGFCWVIQSRFDGSAKITDNFSSLGSTNSKNLSIVKTFDDEPYLFYGMLYFRAYVKTDKGIVYDNHHYVW